MEDQLANLKEIPLPEPIAYTPQTVGWLILLVVLLLGTFWILYLWRRSVSRNRYRGEALKKLDAIEGGGVPLSELPALVKRVVLAFTPREKVAGLTGTPWLEFLDSTLGTRDFVTGPGKLLPTLSYGKPELIEAQLTPEHRRELLRLIRRWIRRHRASI